MAFDPEQLPAWLTWRQRPFPDANLLLVQGRQPDAARLLGRTPEELAAELVDTMLRSGAVVLRHNRLRAATEHTQVATGSLRIPFPRL